MKCRLASTDTHHGRRDPLSALTLVERVAQHGEGCVEALVSSAIFFMIRFGSHIADELVDVFLVAVQNDVVVGRGSPEHEPLTLAVEQHQAVKRGSDLRRDDDVEAALATGLGAEAGGRTVSPPTR